MDHATWVGLSGIEDDLCTPDYIQRLHLFLVLIQNFIKVRDPISLWRKQVRLVCISSSSSSSSSSCSSGDH